MKYLLSILVFLLLIISHINIALAKIEEPSFPYCFNPQGTLISTYNEGIHGIAGSTNTYSGSDQVYKIDDTRLVQCFCSDSGDGIQTNWWKINNLTESEMEYYKNIGYIYIPNGLSWGLEDSSYLAKNQSYSCFEGGIGGGDIGDDGISTKILDLASTGNSLKLITLGLMGIVFTLAGFIIRIHEKG